MATLTYSVQVVLLDIEGTTTPISFVKDTLFPYVVRNLHQHLLDTRNLTETRDDVRALIRLAHEDQRDASTSSSSSASSSPVIAIPESPIHLDASLDAANIEQTEFAEQLSALESNILQQIRVDRKSSALKQLQGHMWRRGYESGELLGVLYEDAYSNIPLWAQQRHLRVCIYSSGSIEAQKLIFGYTSKGSLLPHLEAHFDTGVGHKQQPSSYATIAQRLNVAPEQILFATDVLGEAQAAREAGLQTVITVRPGNAPVPSDCGHTLISSFDEIDVQRSGSS